MLGRTKRKLRRIWDGISTKPEQHGLEEDWVVVPGREMNFIRNGELLMIESISIFNGKTNPIRCLSVEELKTIKVEANELFHRDCYARWHETVWEGRPVLVRLFEFAPPDNGMFRDIVVATQMGTHPNVLKFLACCLETKYPVMIYELPENGTLKNRILRQQSETRSPLEWKDRLRIAWEISHAISYLHTGFRRPIVHRNLTPSNVFLDADDTVKLSDFTLSVSIPEGKTFAQDGVVVYGTYGFVAPEYIQFGIVAERTDVFSFGMLLYLLLRGKEVQGGSLIEELNAQELDPAITTTDEHFLQQMTKSIELLLECTAEEERRPTMVDVATELKNIIALGLDSS